MSGVNRLIKAAVTKAGLTGENALRKFSPDKVRSVATNTKPPKPPKLPR